MDSISLREYLSIVRSAIVSNVPSGEWVRAEISELKVNGNGHCYMTLIEKEDSGKMNVCAKANAIIWSNIYNMVAAMFESVTHERLQPGMSVLVKVSPNFHEAYGFSLIISDIDPTFTLGDMARRRQEVIDKLKADGVWNMNHDLDFPVLPQRVAVISSKTAAGFGDFTNQLDNNTHHFKFYWHLFPAIMQGADAPQSIMEALDAVYMAKDLFDVVVIVRGGGASADMLAFDDYDLTSCCAQFPLPIISGVGHERDTSVLDLVAYQRCKTPTAVGAFLVERMEDAYSRFDAAYQTFVSGVQALLDSEKQRLANATMLVAKSTPLILSRENARLTQLTSNLHLGIAKCCERENSRLKADSARLGSAVKSLSQHSNLLLSQLETRLKTAVPVLLQKQQGTLDLLEQKVKLLSPETLLKKGYSLTLKNGRVVRSAADLQTGDKVELVFADGRKKSIVE